MLERSFGLVRFRSSSQARYALDLGEESWYLGSVKMDSFYKEFATEYTAPWKLIPLEEREMQGGDVSYVKLDETPQGERYKFTTRNNGSSVKIREANE